VTRSTGACTSACANRSSFRLVPNFIRLVPIPLGVGGALSRDGVAVAELSAQTRATLVEIGNRRLA
jgi:hypothetical protein